MSTLLLIGLALDTVANTTDTDNHVGGVTTAHSAHYNFFLIWCRRVADTSNVRWASKALLFRIRFLTSYFIEAILPGLCSDTAPQDAFP